MEQQILKINVVVSAADVEAMQAASGHVCYNEMKI